VDAFEMKINNGVKWSTKTFHYVAWPAHPFNPHALRKRAQYSKAFAFRVPGRYFYGVNATIEIANITTFKKWET
jgi:hypothetical protein